MVLNSGKGRIEEMPGKHLLTAAHMERPTGVAATTPAEGLYGSW